VTYHLAVWGDGGPIIDGKGTPVTLNPWLSGSEGHTDQPAGRAAASDPGSSVRRGLLTPGPVSGSSAVLPKPVSGIPKTTGPARPQPHVPMPTASMPVRRVGDRAALWIVGAHGGAGESSVAELVEGWVPAEHSWPVTDDLSPCPCIVVARTNVRGLLAAQVGLTQWAASGVGPSARLVGLVLIADAPGKLPAPLRDLAHVVAGGAPRVWHVPWIEAWRLGDPVTERMPRPVSKLVGQLRSLAASAAADADLSDLSKEQS
jgi:hypothetical protein